MPSLASSSNQGVAHCNVPLLLYSVCGFILASLELSNILGHPIICLVRLCHTVDFDVATVGALRALHHRLMSQG